MGILVLGSSLLFILCGGVAHPRGLASSQNGHVLFGSLCT